MIRVLHVGLSPNPGGIESMVYSWWKNVDNNIIQFDFLNVYDEPIAYEELFAKNGARILYIPSRKKNVLAHNKELKKILFSNQYEYVHCHVMSLSEPEVVLIGEKSKTKVILHSHLVPSHDIMPFYRRTLHEIGYLKTRNHPFLKLACGKEAGKAMFRTNDFHIIENGIDVESFKFSVQTRNNIRRKLNLQDDVFLVGHVGRPDKQKNYPFLIETFSIIHKKYANSRLILIGAVNDNLEIRQLVAHYGLDEFVLFTGKIANVGEYLSAMDVFLFPSITEGSSVSLIEAQACGLPCIVSDRIDKSTKASDYIFFIPINDSNLMAEEVLKYAKDSIAERVNRKISDLFYIGNSTNKLINFYKDNINT